MLGTVVHYDNRTGIGIVETSKGDAYIFDTQDLADNCQPYQGMAAYFELSKDSKVIGRVTYLSMTLPLFGASGLLMALLLFCMVSCALPKGDKGDPGVQGELGQTGSPGSNGMDGKDGLNGAQGPAGANGQDLANVHAVPFCPGQGSTTYVPNHFPEYGICIAGKLYGVMDDSFHSWLAEVVPGTYMSTSTGLQCTFVVQSNCVVL